VNVKKKLVRIFPVPVWFPPGKNIAVRSVRMQDLTTWKSPASAATKPARLAVRKEA